MFPDAKTPLSPSGTLPIIHFGQAMPAARSHPKTYFQHPLLHYTVGGRQPVARTNERAYDYMFHCTIVIALKHEDCVNRLRQLPT
jgi:hypothetical protein